MTAKQPKRQAKDLELLVMEGCPYCDKVLAAVEKLGIDLAVRDIDEDEAAARKLLEEGGEDMVPCLFVAGKPLYESDDIVAYLKKRFG